jgi:gamma-glutamyltranspeptidase/glutathione hydrolase
MRRIVLVLALVACRQAAVAPVPSSWRYAGEAKPASGAHGMVVSDSALASHVGADVLRSGGNAVDAAVATAFALAVVLPEAGNLGGGGFAVVRAGDGRTAALDFREMAPEAATRDMYLDAGGQPTRDSLDGPRASGVPGSVAGLAALHAKYGSRPWAELLAPAIRLAETGVPVDERLHKAIADVAKRLERWPASAALFLPGGAPPPVGATLRNPDLAATLRRIAADGADGFYRGATAELIAAEMRRDGGLITEADLAGYAARWREPVEARYRGHRIVAMPPPGSGDVVVEIARILDGYDLKALGWHSLAHITLLAEAEQRAFADRNEYLGDPDFGAAPPQLLSDAFVARRRATMDAEHATPSGRVKPGLAEDGNTTHMAVMDETGGAVALSTTLNQLFGSGLTVAGAGFLLNDEMDDFSVKAGVPNLFGLVQGERNRIAAGKRPLSSMAPTLVVGPDGQVVAAVGARGGSRIISATFQVLSNIVDFGMDAGAAVSAPRLHHQHTPDVLALEDGGFDDATKRGLEARGFTVKWLSVIGNAPVLTRAGGRWTGFADPRRGGGAAGP